MQPGRVANARVIHTIMEFRQHTHVVHHVKGRIRFKIDSTFLKKVSHEGLPELQAFMHVLKSLEGVRDIQTSWSASSVVICYDPHRISPERWKALLTGDEGDVAKAIDDPGQQATVLD
jgi:hypothetical protein